MSEPSAGSADAGVAPGDNNPAPHDPYAAFRLRDFRLYSLGWLFATVAYQMQSAAIGWEVYRWTGSALQLGITGGLQALPLILLALPAGHLADVLDRKRIAAVCALLTAICAGLMMWLTWSVDRQSVGTERGLGLMYGLVLAGAVVSTFTRPARAALLPQIVPPRVFSNAVTWNTSIFEVSSMAGPAVAGWVIAAWNATAVFGASAALNIAFMACLLLMRRPAAPGRQAGASGRGDLLAGIRYVWRTKLILATITLDLFAVLLGGATYLLPVFARMLDVGAVGFGWLRAAPAMGALTMALVLAHRPPLRRAGPTLLLAVAGFGAATVVFGLSRWFWLSMLALFLTGALDNISVVVRHTLVQLLTPDSMRGRVSAVNAVFIGASNEIGGLRAGLTAELWGAVASVVLGGCGTIAVVVAAAMIWPQLPRLRSLGAVALEAEESEGRPPPTATGELPVR